MGRLNRRLSEVLDSVLLGGSAQGLTVYMYGLHHSVSQPQSKHIRAHSSRLPVQGVPVSHYSVCRLQHPSVHTVSQPQSEHIHASRESYRLAYSSGLYPKGVSLYRLQHPSVNSVSQQLSKHIPAYICRLTCARCLCPMYVSVYRINTPQHIQYPGHNLITHLHIAVDFLSKGFLPHWY